MSKNSNDFDVKQNQNKSEEQDSVKLNSWGFKGWVGDIPKEWSNKKTPEEYWNDVRKDILPEYLSIFDSTDSKIVKEILHTSSLLNKDYRFRISLDDFTNLTEKDFILLKQCTDNVKVRLCEPGKMLLSLLHKTGIEKYSIPIHLSEQSVKDLFTPRDGVEYYVVSF